MKLTILGCGTVDPHPQRASSGYFFETSAGPILCDIGTGSLKRAMEFSRPIHKLSNLFLTHLHPDHTVDLVPFLFARKYATPPWNECPELTIYGPEGTRDFLDHIFAAWPSVMPAEDSHPIEIVEFSQAADLCFQEAELTISRVPVIHGNMKAFAYRFEEAGKVIALSGDAKLCPGLAVASKDADLFVCECSCFPRGCEPLACREVHMSWEDVAEVCQESNPKRLVLTHIYQPVFDRRPNPLDSLQEALDMKVEWAEDGATYQV